MIDERAKGYWTAVRVLRRVLRTGEQRRLWLEGTMPALAAATAMPAVRRRFLATIAAERRRPPDARQVSDAS
jgi:hypothetical protein